MRVAILDDYQGVAAELADWSVLPPSLAVTFFRDHLPFGPALIERLEPFAIIGAMRERTPFPRELLSQLPNLELLITTGSHNESIDLEAAAEFGVTVCYTRSHGRTASELAMAHLLSLARNLPEEIESVRNGGWQVGLGRGVFGTTLGIVGLGNLGLQVAGFAQAFGMEVLAYDPYVDRELARTRGIQVVESLHQMIPRVDFLTIHVKLNESTRGLIGAEELALMKPDAYLINTSRGPVVDEAALIAACKAGAIGGAALDVFSEEPLPPDHPLRTTPRLQATPHIGYVIRQVYDVYYREMLEDIIAYLEGSPIRLLGES